MINFQELEKVAEFKNGELNWLEGRDINAVYVIRLPKDFTFHLMGSTIWRN